MVRKSVYTVIMMLLITMAIPVHASEGEAYTLGLSLPATTGVFYEAVSNSAEFTAGEVGATLIVVASEYDVETELANVQDLIDQGVAALLFSPTDPVESVGAIEVANAAGIPVFVLGEIVLGDDTEVEIAGQFVVDNVAAGKLAGEALCETLGGAGNVLEVVSVGEDPLAAVVTRSVGFEAYMAKICADITITPVNVFGLDFDAALNALLTELEANEFDALVGLDDVTTDLAINARGNFVLTSRQTGLTVVGIGTHPDLSSSLELEALAAVVIADPWPLGETSVLTSLAYLNGEEVELTVDAALTILNADSVASVRCPNGLPPSVCK